MCKSDQGFREKYSNGWDDPIRPEGFEIDEKRKKVLEDLDNTSVTYVMDTWDKPIDQGYKVNYEKQVLGIVKPKDRQVGGTHYKNMPIQVGEFVTKNNIPWFDC